MKTLFKKADFLLIAVLCLVCAALFLPRFFGAGKLEAVIYCEGAPFRRVDLSTVKEAYTIWLDAQGVVLKVEPGAIGYESSNCPDKLCVRTGRLTRPGDTAACLPSKTVVVLEGGFFRKGPDVMTY